MSKKISKDLVDMVKRAKLGVLVDLDEVEEIEDNKQYLRVIKSMYLEIVNEANFLAENPSNSRLEKKKRAVEEKLERLEEKTGGDSFVSEEFLESNCSCEEEKHILRLLYAKSGVGICVAHPSVRGEVISVALRLLSGADPEDTRKYLVKDSHLRREGLIEVSRTPLSVKGKRRRKPLELVDFQLKGRVIDALQGHVEEVNQNEEKEEKRKKKRKRKPKEKKELVKDLDPDVDLSDVVLPEDMKSTVRAFIEQGRNREKFMDEWNLSSVVGERKGINLLFSGPPGTGKTMLSKAIANEMEKDISMVSFGEILDRYFGNTEGNVSKLFDNADEGPIILVDEADALLQRRAPARSSTDRSENRIINIILQGMENHSGMMIFTTNIAVGLDRAIERRLDLKLELPIPDVEAREKIWAYHIPEELPLADNVELGELAEVYEFTGGQIRNAVVNAARITLREDNERVTLENFHEACEREKEGSDVMDYYHGEEDEEEEMVRGYA